MPAYRYSATDETGKKHKGVLTAADTTDLQARLKTDGLYLVNSTETRPERGKPLKSSVLADFSRQIGVLTGAGVPLVRALSILAEEEGLKPRYARLYAALYRTVRHGTSLSQAMEEQGSAFPPLMIFMFRAAETSGNLEKTAAQLAIQYDKDTRLAARTKSALVYPKILGVLIVAVVAVIMGYVMPQFDDLFSQMETMPLATRILFGISDLVTGYWWALIPCIVLLVIVVKMVARLPKAQFLRDKLVLQLPVVGKLLRTIYTARFARTLSSLYACGIPIVNALAITRDVVGNRYVEQQFDKLVITVRSGRALSEGLSEMDGFVKKLSATVRVGEESGNLEELLTNIADSFDYESEMSMNRLVALVEPAMIVLMAIVVAFIMYAVVMPIYNSYGSIGANTTTSTYDYDAG